MRRRIGYYTPDEVYEAVVARLVVEGCAWADVGCGRDVFPDNHRLARTLAGRCGLLVGIDPDDNLDENPNLHRRVKSTIDAFVGDQAFDVVTLRMVAEHITEPAAAVASLARLTRPGGVVVVYTVDRYSPAAIAARIVPFRLHHAVKRSLWGTEERDTFPVAYRMNTRRELARIFAAGGFEEVWYRRLADCRVFGRFRSLHRLELLAWEVSKSLGLEYPENCIISVFSKNLRS